VTGKKKIRAPAARLMKKRKSSQERLVKGWQEKKITRGEIVQKNLKNVVKSAKKKGRTRCLPEKNVGEKKLGKKKSGRKGLEKKKVVRQKIAASRARASKATGVWGGPETKKKQLGKTITKERMPQRNTLSRKNPETRSKEHEKKSKEKKPQTKALEKKPCVEYLKAMTP